MRGVACQEHPPDPPAVGEADVVVVDDRAQHLDVFRADALTGQQLQHSLGCDQRVGVVPREDRELPAVVAQRGGAVHRGAGRVAVEPQPVDLGPGLVDLRVDDDPAVVVGAPLEADVQAPAGGAGPAVGGDHISGAGLPDLVAHAGAPDGQVDAVGVLVEPGALVPEQHLDVRVAGDPGPQCLFQGGLVDELLGGVAVAPGLRGERQERAAVGVDEGDGPVGEHVGGELIGQADPLPDPQDLLVGGDGAGAGVDVGVALHDQHAQPQLPEQVGRGHPDRPVADHGDVIGGLVHRWAPLGMVDSAGTVCSCSRRDRTAAWNLLITVATFSPTTVWPHREMPA